MKPIKSLSVSCGLSLLLALSLTSCGGGGTSASTSVEDDGSTAAAVGTISDIDVTADPAASVDPMRLRDMYTYSGALSYKMDGELFAETDVFADEQGRVAKTASRSIGENNSGINFVTVYEYNDEGFLKTRVREYDDGRLESYTVTEDVADHRTLAATEGLPEGLGESLETIFYYDAQGRLTGTKTFLDGELVMESICAYDETGKLIRDDNYQADGSQSSYALYEYD